MKPLTQLQREQARDKARKAFQRKLGTAPDTKHYFKNRIGKYPGWAQLLIVALCLLVLFAAFIPSSIRLYFAGYNAFIEQVDNVLLAHWVGIATVFLAEAAQITFTLAYAFFNAKLLLVGIVVATIIAFAGNGTVANPTSFFGLLEAFGPSFLAVLIAYVLKEQWLQRMAMHQESKIAYEQAMHQWQDANANPELHASWQGVYLNALIDALRSNRKDETESMTRQQLVMHAWRELQSDDVMFVLEQAQQAMQHPKSNAAKATTERKQPASNNGKATNEVVEALQGLPEDGPVFVECNYCDWSGNYASKRSASFALRAHLRKHPERESHIIHVNGKVEAVEGGLQS